MNEFMHFNKNNRSSLFIERYLLMFVSLCAGIILLFTKKYVISIILLIFFLILVIRLLEAPKSVSLCSEFVEIGKNKLIWDDIDKVEFTISDPGRDSLDTVIRIFVKSKKYAIHTRLYNNSKDLRSLFEVICAKKNIPYTVKDKGLY